MSKSKTRFVCQSCGFESYRWMGKCSGCGSWNSFVEEKIISEKDTGRSTISGERIGPTLLSEVKISEESRAETSIEEMDRVLGGGLVRGSLVLLGGDPGIGKSTLLLQAVNQLSTQGKVLYVSGEESAEQIALRGGRLGIEGSSLYMLAENNMEAIIEQMNKEDPKYVIIDSIQTVYTEEFSSAPGTVGQVRECTMKLLAEAKGKKRTIILVGHVTKTGNIAGPRVLEHMVDAVLYLEGDKDNEYRILRSVKNRFGSTNEIGVFEMRDKGLRGIVDPSKIFLTSETADTSGTVVFPSVEGSRVLFLEVQALASNSVFGNPRRLATGYDLNRLHLMSAVIEKKMGMFLGATDIYLNVAGGIKTNDPAADLAVCMSIISSYKGQPIGKDWLIIGEVGLTGSIRPGGNIEKRIKEGLKLGFSKILISAGYSNSLEEKISSNIYKASNLMEAVGIIFS